jgi:DNA-binding transcriptional regulator GbsR (MarR family)
MNDRENTSRAAKAPAPRPVLTERHVEALGSFIRFWGEMASRWGINRTMAQIHALLYAVEEPLDTDTIMERLRISRGNANMNLRSLLNWNLVRKVRLPGSRKDYYAAEKDVWEITLQIIRERERREIRPVVQQLQECRDQLTGGGDRPCAASTDPQEQRFCERIDNLIKLMLVFEGLSRTLLPFIQVRNADLLRQLAAMAEPPDGFPEGPDHA